MTFYLIDTNILIYYLAGAIPDDKKPVIDRILQESFNISIITRIELLGWKEHTPEGLDKARHLLDCAQCLPLTDTLAEKTIELRALVTISLPDAVIAAIGPFTGCNAGNTDRERFSSGAGPRHLQSFPG